MEFSQQWYQTEYFADCSTTFFKLVVVLVKVKTHVLKPYTEVSETQANGKLGSRRRNSIRQNLVLFDASVCWIFWQVDIWFQHEVGFSCIIWIYNCAYIISNTLSFPKYYFGSISSSRTLRTSIKKATLKYFNAVTNYLLM